MLLHLPLSSTSHKTSGSSHQCCGHPISPLPSTNLKGLRSFHFFADVTAPSLGGVCDSTFWKTEIPRACHLDGAIWHAIISLASAHESSVSTVSAGTPTTAENLHTLLHYNLAVQDH
ncbi:hypothetical protein PENPOL_c006G08782 [Penicillium polonicum]|uniref:Uncharacterized protein n=1 Tax=Penicillium polonicum TaxID=60169 RepID=A0A1V6NJZ9_PENPO|nr:hypothetical protein PENPOL_c006G08782 [Penicillium polonicum]